MDCYGSAHCVQYSENLKNIKNHYPALYDRKVKEYFSKKLSNDIAEILNALTRINLEELKKEICEGYTGYKEDISDYFDKFVDSLVSALNNAVFGRSFRIQNGINCIELVPHVFFNPNSSRLKLFVMQLGQ